MLIGLLASVLFALFLLLASNLIRPMVEFMESYDGMISELTEVLQVIKDFFTGDLATSISIYAADVGLFYAVMIVFFTFGLIPDEIKKGKLIIPLAAGYDKKTLALSKVIVYSIALGLPVIPGYLVYYWFGGIAYGFNFAFGHALYNAILLAFGMSAHACVSLALSMLYKYKLATMFSMIGFIIILPEIFARLSIGVYFPTYVYTYVFNSGENPLSTIIPILEMLIIMAGFTFCGVNFGMKYKFER